MKNNYFRRPERNGHHSRKSSTSSCWVNTVIWPHTDSNKMSSLVLQRMISSPSPPPSSNNRTQLWSNCLGLHTLRIMRRALTSPTLQQSSYQFFTWIEAAFSWSSSRCLCISTTGVASLWGRKCSTISPPNWGHSLTAGTSANEDARSAAVEHWAFFQSKRWQKTWVYINL